MLDDTTLDKPYAENMDLVTYHWSGKHGRVVKGINLLTLLWTGDETLVPCDFRVYDKPMGGSTKNESFREMLVEADKRGFNPDCVLFDSWYSSLDNLKLLRSLGWRWLTRLKANRLVNTDGSGHVPVRDLEIPSEGRVVHLKGYGLVKVFRVFSKDGEAEHWAARALHALIMTVALFHEALSLFLWAVNEVLSLGDAACEAITHDFTLYRSQGDRLIVRQ